jgi:hypothetical protein
VGLWADAHKAGGDVVARRYQGLGLWFTGGALHNGPGDDFASTSYVVHRTASGSWQRISTGSTKAVPPKSTTTGAGLGDLALIPGTRSLWGVGGSASGTAGSNAVIWAYGNI